MFFFNSIYIHLPPSTSRTVPVIILASSEHKKHAALPISWGVEKRPIGIVDKNACFFFIVFAVENQKKIPYFVGGTLKKYWSKLELYQICIMTAIFIHCCAFSSHINRFKNFFDEFLTLQRFLCLLKV